MSVSDTSSDTNVSDLMSDASSGGHTPLCLASKHGHRDAVALLLAQGAEVNQANKDGWTPRATAS